MARYDIDDYPTMFDVRICQEICIREGVKFSLVRPREKLIKKLAKIDAIESVVVEKVHQLYGSAEKTGEFAGLAPSMTELVSHSIIKEVIDEKKKRRTKRSLQESSPMSPTSYRFVPNFDSLEKFIECLGFVIDADFLAYIEQLDMSGPMVRDSDVLEDMSLTYPRFLGISEADRTPSYVERQEAFTAIPTTYDGNANCEMMVKLYSLTYFIPTDKDNLIYVYPNLQMKHLIPEKQMFKTCLYVLAWFAHRNPSHELINSSTGRLFGVKPRPMPQKCDLPIIIMNSLEELRNTEGKEKFAILFIRHVLQYVIKDIFQLCQYLKVHRAMYDKNMQEEESSDDDGDDSNRCPCCLSSRGTIKLPCGHPIHVSCGKELVFHNPNGLRYNAKCPCCREEFVM
jgi:hypothetical protein